MKRLLFYCALLLLVLAIPCVQADTERIITPAQSDLKEQQLRETAAEFFSVKCGIPKENLLKAHMEIQLKQSGYWKKNSAGKSQWHGTEEPKWTIHVQSFPGENGQHQGMHLLYLDRSGAIIAWQAHGAEHTELNPDFLRSGSPASPLPTDAKADEIIEAAQQELRKNHGVQSAESLIYKTAFVYEEHFNWGKIPVWLVYIYKDEALTYKAVYSYDGRMMSLVPAQQDYTCYVTPDEEFFYSVFKERWSDEMDKAFLIQEGAASKADSQKWLSGWAELYHEWAIQHPYSAEDQLVNELLKQHADLLVD